MRMLEHSLCCTHEIGEITERYHKNFYGVFHFSTPFTYEVDGKMLLGKTDEILISPPNYVAKHGPATKDTSFTNAFFYFTITEEEKNRIFDNIPLPILKPFSANKNSHVSAIIKKVQKEMNLKKFESQRRIDLLFEIFLIDIYREYINGKYSISSLSRMDSAREQILSELESNWTLENMAKIAGYSPSRFSELYTLYYGISPKSDLIQSRLERAKSLLTTTSEPISIIASQCGFKDQYFFSKFFAKKVGVSPTAYRKTLNFN